MLDHHDADPNEVVLDRRQLRDQDRDLLLRRKSRRNSARGQDTRKDEKQ